METIHPARWRCPSGCTSLSLIRWEESCGRRTGLSMQSSRSKGFHACSGQTGVTITSSATRCIWTCLRQRPISEKGGKANPFYWFQPRVNASVPRASGSGFQLTNLRSYLVRRLANRSILRGLQNLLRAAKTCGLSFQSLAS